MKSVFLLVLMACNGDVADTSDTGKSETDTDTDTDGDTDADADTDADGDADTDTTATGDTGEPLPPGPGVGGTLIDGAGNPIADAQILACTHTYCLTADSGPDGWFWFSVDPDTAFAMKTHEDRNVVPRRGAGLEPAVVVGSAAVTIGDLCQPDLPTGVAWGTDDPQTFETAGLTLTLSRADVSLAILEDYDDVATVALTEACRPSYPDLGAETVEAVYAVHPFAATSTSPIAVSAPSALPVGTEVHFRSVSSLGGELSAPAVGHADGARVTTDPGEGLYELSQVVISVP